MHRFCIAILAVLFACQSASAAQRPVTVRPGKFTQWDALENGAHKTYRSGGLTLTFAAKMNPAIRDVSVDGDRDFTVTITAPGGTKIAQVLSGGFAYPVANFSVGTLDPSLPVSQVIVEVYSGGAHCCTTRIIYVFMNSGWKAYTVKYGSNDDPDEVFPKDLNADGVADFVLSDDDFAYAFSSFAGSWLPPRIFTIRGGAVVDVSNSRRYDRIFRSDLRKAKSGCVPTDLTLGICVGVAADGARLGAFKKNWRWFLKHIPDSRDSWTVPETCDLKSAGEAGCPKLPVPFTADPDAVASFLRKHGYITRREEQWAYRETRKKEYQRP